MAEITTTNPLDISDPTDSHSTQAPVIRSAGLTLFGSAVGGVLVILGEMLAARLLQSHAYGLYASGITVAKIGEALAVFGLPVGIFHYIPVYRRQSRTDLVVGTVYAAALLPLLLGFAFAALIWFAAPWLAHYVFRGADVVDSIRLISISIPFMAFSEVLGAITRGYGYAKYYVIVNNLIPPVVFVACLGLMARLDARPIWIAGAVALANLLACVVGILAVVRVAGPELWKVRPIFPFRALYEFSSQIMLNTSFYMIFAWTGILAVAAFLGTNDVGIYRVCLQVVVPFEMIVLAFHAATGPVYPVLAKENKLSELEEAYGTAIRWMIMLDLPIGIILAWNRTDLLALLGPQFTAGATAVIILAVGFSVSACFGTVGYLFLLTGRKSVETWNAGLATILHLLLAIVLIPRFGLSGAAFATTFCFFLLNASRVWELRHFMGLRTFRPYFLRVFAIAIAAALGAFVALQRLGILQGRDMLSVVSRIVVMGVLYVSVLWMFGLNNHDKNMLRGLVSNKAQDSPKG